MKRELSKPERLKFDIRIEALQKKYLKKEKVPLGANTTYNYKLDYSAEIYESEKEKWEKRPDMMVETDKRTEPKITTHGPTNIFTGDFSNSTVTIDQSITDIETYIEKNGGDDKEELSVLLNEAKLLIEDIKETSQIRKRPDFAKRLGGHMKKHSYLYGEIMKLIGIAVVNLT